MACFSSSATTLNPSAPLNFPKSSSPHFFRKSFPAPTLRQSSNIITISTNDGLQRKQFLLQCTNFSTPTIVPETDPSDENGTVGNGQTLSPVKRQRRRYRKQYPGEKEGITEEMRFVAMKLRNSGKKVKRKNKSGVDGEIKEEETENVDEEEDNSEVNDDDGDLDLWQPSMEGLMRYLVDSELVFRTIERIVDESTDVSYVYFRKTGLERSDCISKDLEWLREQGNVIPQPSNPGVTYAQYLEELAEKRPPLFLSHFYNIYFSHIAGGQVIAKQVSKKLLDQRELEFYKWEGDAEELLRSVREKLNSLGEYWSRDEKNKCLSEATKAFRFLGQIVRLIILFTPV